MNKTPNVGLGRIHVPDDRDRSYLFSAVVEEAPPQLRFRYWWNRGWRGDQGATPQCVAYAWMHWLEDGPTTQRPLSPGAGPIFPPVDVYRRAQKLDGIPGENYDGTTVRGGAKALQEKGVIGAYYWAWSLNALTNAVLSMGPVVVGTNWYEAMFRPDEDGFIHIGGDIAGGHAYVLNGCNVEQRKFRLKNSWGSSWGDNGHAWISFQDIGRLLWENGEACIATEVRL